MSCLLPSYWVTKIPRGLAEPGTEQSLCCPEQGSHSSDNITTFPFFHSKFCMQRSSILTQLALPAQSPPRIGIKSCPALLGMKIPIQSLKFQGEFLTCRRFVIPVCPVLFILHYSPSHGPCCPPGVSQVSPEGICSLNLQDRPFILQLSSLYNGESAATPARKTARSWQAARA